MNYKFFLRKLNIGFQLASYLLICILWGLEYQILYIRRTI